MRRFLSFLTELFANLWGAFWTGLAAVSTLATFIPLYLHWFTLPRWVPGTVAVVAWLLAPYRLYVNLAERREALGGKNKGRQTDLSGRWEGWSYRTLTKEWRPSAHELKQNGSHIIANAWGPQNWARGLCASIVGDGATYELIWSYQTSSVGSGRPGDSHKGTHFFKYSERNGHKYLEGTYATDRIREDETVGAGGFHRLIWVSKKLKSAVDFKNEAHWGMPKPNSPP